MGVVVPSREFLAGAARADAAARGAADLRRSDDRLPRGLRRCAVTAGHRAGSHDARQDRRRRPAGRRVRRPGRDHGSCAAGRQSVSGRHAQRQSAGHGRRLRDAASCCATSRRTSGWSNLSARLGSRAARRGNGGRRAASVRPRRQHDDAVLCRRSRLRDWPTASRCDTQRFARWFWGMLDRGVYLPCSQFEALFVSAAHTRSGYRRDDRGGARSARRRSD